MLKRDYIMKLIEQLTGALSRILFKKENRDLNGAMEEINRAYTGLLGLDPEMIRSMPDAEIISFLEISGSTQYERCMIIAELKREEAGISELMNGPENEDAIVLYFDSLNLYLEAMTKKDEFITEFFPAHLEEVIKKVENFELPHDIGQKLFKYYEITGRYAEAEDILYELIDAEYSPVYTEAVAFYERLLKKSDEELTRGNLPRTEVIQALDETKQKIKNS